MSIRVVVVDDHAFFRKGVTQFLSAQRDIEVVGECSDGLSGLGVITAVHPDIAIVDIVMPHMDGLRLAQEVRRRGLDVRVVLLVGSITDEQTIEAVRSGIRGVVLKDMAPDFLLQCLRVVHSGGQWLEKESIARVLERLVNGKEPAQAPDALTAREQEIAQMVADGLSNREIAARLFISVSTVKSHLHAIFEKKGVVSRLQLSLTIRESKPLM